MDMVPPSSAPTLTDRELLPRLRAGEEQAFEAFARRFCDPMYYVARRLLRNEEDTRDVVQDAFLQAFRSLHKFEGRSELKTWLHRIVVNAALMKLRGRKNQPERSIDDWLPRFAADEHHLVEPACFDSRLEEMLQKRELRTAVLEAIDKLPAIYRTVVLLRDIEEVDTEETARLLDVGEGVVRTRLHRGRQALRTLLEPLFREGTHELP